MPRTRWLACSCLASVALIGCRAEPEPQPVEQPPPAVTPAPIPAPPAGGFALALWPGEGIPEFDAVGNPLVLRQDASVEAPVRDTMYPAAGARLRYDSTRNVTVTPARIVVLRADTISGRDFGAVTSLSRESYHATVPTVDVAVDVTSAVELLQHRAEGACFVRVSRQVIEASPCPLFDVGAFRPAGEPVTAWWIFLSGDQDGGGWVLVSDSTIRLAGRRF